MEAFGLGDRWAYRDEALGPPVRDVGGGPRRGLPDGRRVRQRLVLDGRPRRRRPDPRPRPGRLGPDVHADPARDRRPLYRGRARPPRARRRPHAPRHVRRERGRAGLPDARRRRRLDPDAAAGLPRPLGAPGRPRRGVDDAHELVGRAAARLVRRDVGPERRGVPPDRGPAGTCARPPRSPVAVGQTTGAPFPRAEAEAAGWAVLDPDVVAPDWRRYRAFLGSSRGELSVAKETYVKARTGWFSCRSACYLAAGRPVVTEDTGWTRTTPHGLGLLPSTTPPARPRRSGPSRPTTPPTPGPPVRSPRPTLTAAASWPTCSRPSSSSAATGSPRHPEPTGRRSQRQRRVSTPTFQASAPAPKGSGRRVEILRCSAPQDDRVGGLGAGGLAGGQPACKFRLPTPPR